MRSIIARPESLRSWVALLSLVLPTVSAGVPLAIVGSDFAFDGFIDPSSSLGANVLGVIVTVVFSLLFVAWIVLPHALTSFFVLRAGRHGWSRLAAVELGSVGVSAVTLWALDDYWASGSSTSALIFAILPVMQSFPLLAAFGLARLTGPSTAA